MTETAEDDGALAAQAVLPPPAMGVLQRRLRIVSHFLTGQIAVQGLNFCVGFFLLRWLDKVAYAQYSVAFAFQSTVGMLVDLGFTGSIIALVGEYAHRPEVVGRYIRTAQYFRTRSFVIIISIATLLYPFVVWNQPWGWQMKTLLFVGIFIALAADNLLMYGSVLLIHRKLAAYYRAQIAAGIWRQGICWFLYIARALNSWTASWATAIASAIYGLLYRRAAVPLIEIPAKADPATNRQMLNYVAPLVPSMIFAAFQGQISIALITLFGKTQSIADVGALGRLGQLFTLLHTFNQVIIEPNIARISRASLAVRYLQILALQVGIGAALSLFAFEFPAPLLWIIGPKYAQLRGEVGWVAMTGAVTYVVGGLWTMNSARKWIYWWGTGFYIIMVLAMQVTAACLLDLSKTHDVIRFAFWTSVALLVVNASTSLYGFRYGVAKRNLGPEQALVSNSESKL